MLREFDARLQKGENKGAWTCVVWDGAAEFFGTRGLVKVEAHRSAGWTAEASWVGAGGSASSVSLSTGVLPPCI